MLDLFSFKREKMVVECGFMKTILFSTNVFEASEVPASDEQRDVVRLRHRRHQRGGGRRQVRPEERLVVVDVVDRLHRRERGVQFLNFEAIISVTVWGRFSKMLQFVIMDTTICRIGPERSH